MTCDKCINYCNRIRPMLDQCATIPNNNENNNMTEIPKSSLTCYGKKEYYSKNVKLFNSSKICCNMCSQGTCFLLPVNSDSSLHGNEHVYLDYYNYFKTTCNVHLCYIKVP